MVKHVKKVYGAEDLVTQEELQYLDELDKIRREADWVRTRIRTRILAGARVEPGSYIVLVGESARYYITAGDIRQLLGVLGDQILAALPKKQTFVMRVVPDWSDEPKTEPEAAFDTARIKDHLEPDQEFDLAKFVLTAIPLILDKKDPEPSKYECS